DRGNRTAEKILDAPLRLALVRYYSGERGPGIRRHEDRYRPEPAGLFQSEPGVARWPGIRRSQRWLEPAPDRGRVRGWESVEYRLDVVDDLRAIVRKHGFKPVLVGGIYYLEGRLGQLVASSLVTGLFWLNVLFVAIAWVVARSIRGTLAMIVSLSLVPLCMLGGIGWLHVPMDIISSPATNVCIGIAIDSMIHLVFGVRRAQRDGVKGWDAWVAGRREQWRGIV